MPTQARLLPPTTLVLAALFALAPTVLRAQPAATTTTLAMTSAGTTVTTVASGNVVTLTAKVAAGSSPVTLGLVNFCDASSAHCTGVHFLGFAQLTGAGSAVMRFIPGLGHHMYQTVFVGTNSDASSSSSTADLTVTGTYSTASVIAEGGSAGNYTLTATVAGIGGSASPSGTLSFLDTSNGNAVLTAANLGKGTANLSFTNPATPPTGSEPIGVATADFNGDGIPDIAITNASSDSVTVLLGKGDGTFTAAPSPSTGDRPIAIVAGDFNGDGKADLATANTSDSSITVLLGNGDGTFTASSFFPAGGNGPFAITTGDFNGDGKADLAFTNWDGFVANTVSVLLGNGDGTFTVAPNLTTGVEPEGIVAGDFNDDGKVDLAVAESSESSLSIFLGNGDGTFTATVSPSTGPIPDGVAVGDLNGDGILDLVVANLEGPLTVLLGNGDGTFTEVPNSAFSADAVAIGDFNGDGIADLAGAQSVGSGLVILLGNGDGTFTQGPTPNTGLNPFEIGVGDFNGDGIPDMVVTNFGDNTATVLLSEPSVTATATASGISIVGIGTHLVEASYPGDANYSPSTSSTVPLTAVPPPPTPAVTLSIGMLTFATQVVGSTSAAQTVTLTNSGNADLTVSSVLVTGDFAQTNTCNVSVAAGKTCTIMVTFAPTAAGTRTGTLSIADNAMGSPQSVALTGTGSSITLSAATSTLSISSPGGSVTDSINVSAVNGFSGTVTLSCEVTYQGSGNATDSPACTLNPQQASLSTASPLNTTLTVSTTTMTSSSKPALNKANSGAILAALFFVGFLPWRRWRDISWLGFVVIAVACAAIGCGGSSGGSHDTTPSPGTTTGKYQVVVNATSSTVETSVTISLTLQ
jgi:hypothetical protein